nr:NUDIX domain-containing protein [Mesorhizobium sp. IRAMC:0171]
MVGSRLVLVPGARIVIEREDGCILLHKRTDFDRWGLPGGSAEEGENIETIIIREVAEETGLAVRDVKPFAFGSDPRYETFEFPNGDRTQFFALIFYTRSFAGDAAVMDDESSAVGWFAPDALPDMLSNMARSVEAYLRFKKTGEFQMI